MGAERVTGVPELAGRSLKFHIVGIGGAGMNAIATVLVAMGHRVSGSDLHGSPVLERLERLGVRTFVGHDAEHVGDADVVTFSSAVKADNVEIVEAGRRGMVTVPRWEAMRAICRARRTLAVSGTHGKTTTTAMLAAVLAGAGLDPGFIVGGELPGMVGGAKWGSGPWLVVEADESDGTFLCLGAEAVVVTSIEADHLDHFGDLSSLSSAFEAFVAQAPGPKVICLDDPGAAALVSALPALPGLVTYGTAEAAGCRATSIELGRASASFDIELEGRALGRFCIPVPGLHNVRNATAALAMSAAIGVPSDAARAGLASYGGVARRFEARGSRDGVTYVDDYAHNPGKVRAVLAAARDGGWDRVVAVFQPHRYTRTSALWRELGDSLTGADLVVVTGIYGAGEPPVPGVSGRLVADAARSARPGLRVEYVEERAALVRLLQALLQPGDLCLTMSAGDLTTLPSTLMSSPLLSGAGQAASAGQSGRGRR